MLWQKKPSEMTHDEVIQSYISKNSNNESIPYEQANDFLTLLENRASLRIVLENDEGQIDEFGQENLNLSLNQEKAIVAYLNQYGLEHDKLDKDEDFKEMFKKDAVTGNENWYKNSPRSQSVPQAVWPFMSSYGKDGNLVVEPIFMSERVVSGYTVPNTEVEIYVHTMNFRDDISESRTTSSDANGYFSEKFENLLYQSKTTVSADGYDEVVDVPVYQWFTTPLAHSSGNLTLERVFINQDYIEGKTLPNVDICLTTANGYGTAGMNVGKSDSKGYFKLKPEGMFITDKYRQIMVSIQDPSTGKPIVVVPYLWTQEELDNVNW